MKKGHTKGHAARYDGYNFAEDLKEESKKNQKARKF